MWALPKNYSTNVGKDNPRVYYNILPKGGFSSNFAQIFVQMTEETNISERSECINRLRKKFEQYPGAKIKAIEFEQGAPVEAPLVVRIYGDDLDILKNIADKVEKQFLGTPGTLYVNNPMASVNTDLRVNVNYVKAGLLGIPTIEIDRTLRMAISGMDLGTFQDKVGDSYDIKLKISKTTKVGFDIFNNIYVSSANGSQIPLSNLTNLVFESSPNRIQHYDRDRYTSISGFVADGYLTPEVLKKIKDKVAKISIPKDYKFEIAGEAEQSKEAFGGLGSIILITIFGILAVLILEFKTFRASFIVLSVIPLGLIGAVGALFLTNNTLSFTAIIGIIALAGIEVKNSILLVDYTNYLRIHENLGIDEAIEKAGKTRFIPIVLTTMTAIGGLIPIALENSPLISPLAIAIIGGLISSLVLTRIITPVMYKVLST